MNTTPNPFASPEKTRASPPNSGRDTYNMVTDLIAGSNVRWRDNLIQAAVCLVCLAVGVALGYLLYGSAEATLLGAGIGLLSGLLGSGIFLMVFRAVRHAQGRHE